MNWKDKLSSRKFWGAVVNFVTNLLLAFRVAESDVAQVAAIIMAGGGMIAYIIGEGLADAAGARVIGEVENNDEVIVEDDASEMQPRQKPPQPQYFESGSE